MYIERYLPKEYSQMMTSFANLSSKTHVNQYCSQIGEDWATGSSTMKRKNNSRSTTRQASSNVDAQQIKITLVDDTNEAERQTFDIGSSTTLKSLFNDYAEKRGISLRQLRFSFNGSMLFLSSAGHKTPEEMGMHDEDFIMVHDMTEKPQEETTKDNDMASPTKCKPKKNKSSNKKGKKKSSKKSSQQQQQHQRSSSFEEPTKTLKEYKIDHSRQLTKIHEEASDQFKQIRQKLNNLDIERCPKKNKKRSNKSSKNKSSGTTASQPVIMNPSKEGLGGKAGKSHFVVQVGEVQHLYKSTKSSQQLQQQKRTSSMTVHTLDLHGLTVDEALVQLDESLQTWVKTAMEGCYPFVQPAVIICGCGNQVLSEVVSDWIRNNDKVSNATKSFTRSIGRASAA
jgi:DNA-nicking Smr family endonuclease